MSQRISGGFRKKRAYRASRAPVRDAALHGALATAMLAAIVSQGALAEVPADAFTMIMFDGSPGATQIESGDYALAARIARTMAVSSPTSRFESMTQICVASLKSGELDAAAKACDRAVMAASSRDLGAAIYKPMDVAARTMRQVIAYTNRGVVHAITGADTAAVSDFEAALALNAEQHEPRANLAYLERRGDYVAESQD